MKTAFLGIALFISGSAMATVLEMENATTDRVIEVYEEMREEQVEARDNTWINEFENENVGSEMDHLKSVKRSAAVSEEL
jgi:hypothetical protein